ncbi:hypothetical protein DCAR_0309989 [Daucus carota subsp. sativus]|uniref:Uncharacterized protein n=1 Tax=Daucus carota subsp. sativus TaxID=79200 RepID=A0AAF0WMN0_DAUCS|nr:hypothetical protein DCAR_0309989 [Daucus carota subsp. sativus]
MHLLLFQKLIFFVLLVAAEKNQLLLAHDNGSQNTIVVPEMKSVSRDEASSPVIGIDHAVSEMIQRIQEKEQKQQRETPHSLNEFFPNKRTVPDASDPIHNR